MRRPTATRLGATQVALVAVLLAALVGALVGGLVGASRAVSSTATTLLALQPDSSVSSDADASLDPSVDVSDAFLQTELVYLNSDRFVSSVEDTVGDDVDVEATRVNQSNVVQVSATADSPEVALAASEAAASSYVDQRTQAASDRLDTQAAAVQDQLDIVLQQIASATDGAVLPPDSSQSTALQGRYENLLTLSSSIALARQASDQGATVLQPAVLAEPDGVSPTALGVVLGALLGALVGAGGALVWRQRSTTLRGESDLVGVERVLAPRAPATGADLLLPAGAGATSALARAAQRQSAQLLAGRDDAPVVVAFVGATEGAGTSVVAVHHAAAMARRAPVLLVCAGDAAPDAGPAPAGRLPGVDRHARGLLDLGVAGREPLTAQDVMAVVQASEVDGLLVVTAGTRPGRVGDLEHLVGRGLVAALRGTGHDVVVDAPSLDRSGAGPRLADAADVTALVVGVGASSRDDVQVGVRALTRDGVAPAVLLDEPITGRRHRSPGRPAPAAAEPAGGARPAPRADRGGAGGLRGDLGLAPGDAEVSEGSAGPQDRGQDPRHERTGSGGRR
ncbi:hypothetical protein WDZ17_08405 [Pseudokineococcus basanitobsidens]|uniref:Subunit length determinant protein n=1 Tax=Pseudokineococcus basanitobsidens TaxID=1926649 RepID=A0ABU8RJZ5_9ACTN